ncbi:hypothetical protein Ancab_040405 [Ancistrocladus abbreviatus]
MRSSSRRGSALAREDILQPLLHHCRGFHHCRRQVQQPLQPLVHHWRVHHCSSKLQYLLQPPFHHCQRLHHYRMPF